MKRGYGSAVLHGRLVGDVGCVRPHVLDEDVADGVHHVEINCQYVGPVFLICIGGDVFVGGIRRDYVGQVEHRVEGVGLGIALRLLLASAFCICSTSSSVLKYSEVIFTAKVLL